VVNRATKNITTHVSISLCWRSRN